MTSAWLVSEGLALPINVNDTTLVALIAFVAGIAAASIAALSHEFISLRQRRLDFALATWQKRLEAHQEVLEKLLTLNDMCVDPNKDWSALSNEYLYAIRRNAIFFPKELTTRLLEARGSANRATHASTTKSPIATDEWRDIERLKNEAEEALYKSAGIGFSPKELTELRKGKL